MNRVPLCHANAVGWGINLGSVLEGSVFLLLFWIFLNTGIVAVRLMRTHRCDNVAGDFCLISVE